MTGTRTLFVRADTGLVSGNADVAMGRVRMIGWILSSHAYFASLGGAALVWLCDDCDDTVSRWRRLKL